MSSHELALGTADQSAFRYVLGQLSEDERQRFEGSYLSDHDVFERLEAVEDDLIDAYVRKELSTADREGLEKHFLVTPERRQRLEFARALVDRDPVVPKIGRRDWASFGSVAAALACASFVYVLQGQTSRSSSGDSRPSPGTAETRTIEPPSKASPGTEARTESAAAVPKQVVDPLRGSSLVSRVDVMNERGALGLRVLLRGAGVHARYLLELEDSRAESVWSSPPLPATAVGNGPALVLDAELPASLAPGRYFLILKGVSPPEPPEPLEQSVVTVPAR